jgi:multidrug efflux pump subunit AcrA (membrane-fusion protein)
MKLKLILTVLVVLAVSGGIVWTVTHRSPASAAASSAGRKILYYTCSMHTWVREHKPGPCPICGMKLVPVYEPSSAQTSERKIKFYRSTMNLGETNPTPAKDSMGMDMTPVYEDNENTNLEKGTITLGSESISAINVQTDSVEHRPVRRTLHFAGEITGNSWTAAWFEFTAYERDLQWLKIGQTFDVRVLSAPDKIYHAQIELRGSKPFADKDFDMMSGSTTVRAEILNPPIVAGELGAHKIFNGLHAEAHVIAETEPVLAIPRSAVISRGIGPMVYVDNGDGHYAPRAVRLGRIGDEFSEVLAGLNEGEKVVTTGNVLIDSEAQLTGGQ